MNPTTPIAKRNMVVPHAGTWIEIVPYKTAVKIRLSFPTRERGLKYYLMRLVKSRNVVPHAGTWIEIVILNSKRLAAYVVPHAGTWIEIIAYA